MAAKMMIVPQIVCILLGTIFEVLQTTEALHIAVIGAGASGIASAKNALEQGHHVTIFEQTGALGGVWYYTNEVGKDKYTVHTHSPLYESFRSPMPYQVLEFPDHYYPKTTESFPLHWDVWNYINKFARDNNITEHIKFHHFVDGITSVENNKWRLNATNMEIKKRREWSFDAIFVCTGICSSSFVPRLQGVRNYKGKLLHSHDYRKPEPFKLDSVLVIGQDPSGDDIVRELLQSGTKVAHSYMDFPNLSPLRNFVGKAQGMLSTCFIKMEGNDRGDAPCLALGNVKRFNGPYEVEFENGAKKNFTAVIYATGYKLYFPFLDKSCGIQVKVNNVEPLYKNILNIEHPTMAFIALPNWELHFRMYDLQARFALEYMSENKELPSKPDMIKDMQTYPHRIRTIKDRKTRKISTSHKEYYADLSSTARIANVRIVFSELYENALVFLNQPGFRNYRYVVDGNDFERIREHKTRDEPYD